MQLMIQHYNPYNPLPMQEMKSYLALESTYTVKLDNRSRKKAWSLILKVSWLFVFMKHTNSNLRSSYLSEILFIWGKRNCLEYNKISSIKTFNSFLIKIFMKWNVGLLTSSMVCIFERNFVYLSKRKVFLFLNCWIIFFFFFFFFAENDSALILSWIWFCTVISLLGFLEYSSTTTDDAIVPYLAVTYFDRYFSQEVTIPVKSNFVI